jgi:hypothetical protein
MGIDLDEAPIKVFDVTPMPPQNAAPPRENLATLGNDGEPTQGVDNRQYNPERQRLAVSTPGNPGGAEGYA